jgi:hypothetical protein
LLNKSVNGWKEGEGIRKIEQIEEKGIALS